MKGRNPRKGNKGQDGARGVSSGYLTALKKGNVTQIMKHIRTGRVNPNFADKMGMRAASAVISKPNSARYLRELKERGATLNFKEPLSGMRLAHMAALSGDISALKALKGLGVPIDQRSEGGLRPVDFIVASSDMRLMNKMHELGIPFGRRNVLGKLPEHYAKAKHVKGFVRSLRTGRPESEANRLLRQRVDLAIGLRRDNSLRQRQSGNL